MLGSQPAAKSHKKVLVPASSIDALCASAVRAGRVLVVTPSADCGRTAMSRAALAARMLIGGTSCRATSASGGVFGASAGELQQQRPRDVLRFVAVPPFPDLDHIEAYITAFAVQGGDVASHRALEAAASAALGVRSGIEHVMDFARLMVSVYHDEDGEMLFARSPYANVDELQPLSEAVRRHRRQADATAEGEPVRRHPPLSEVQYQQRTLMPPASVALARAESQATSRQLSQQPSGAQSSDHASRVDYDDPLPDPDDVPATDSSAADSKPTTPVPSTTASPVFPVGEAGGRVTSPGEGSPGAVNPTERDNGRRIAGAAQSPDAANSDDHADDEDDDSDAGQGTEEVDRVPREMPEFPEERDFTLVESSGPHYDERVPVTRLSPGRRLAGIFVKNAIPTHVCKRAADALRAAATTNNLRHRTNGGKAPKTGIVGHYDYLNNATRRKCRLTKYTRENWSQIATNLQDFLTRLNDVYRLNCPEHHRLQNAAIPPQHRLLNTCFSTLSVNDTFRTAKHTDKGDFRSGFGCVCVLDGSYSGCHLAFPGLGKAFALRPGDVIMFDTSLEHGNTEPHFLPWSRLGIVAYFRTGLASQRCEAEHRDRLLNSMTARMSTAPIMNSTRPTRARRRCTCLEPCSCG
jgi:hypothetical protein